MPAAEIEIESPNRDQHQSKFKCWLTWCRHLRYSIRPSMKSLPGLFKCERQTLKPRASTRDAHFEPCSTMAPQGFRGGIPDRWHLDAHRVWHHAGSVPVRAGILHEPGVHHHDDPGQGRQRFAADQLRRRCA